MAQFPHMIRTRASFPVENIMTPYRTKLWAIATPLVFILLACESKPDTQSTDDEQTVATPKADASSPREPVERVKFAHIIDEDVQVSYVSAEGVQARSRLEVEHQPIALRWLGSERLAILTEEATTGRSDREYSYRLYVYEGGELDELDLPDDEAWKQDHDLDFSAHDRGGHFVDTGNDELWMRRCAGGYLGDANNCSQDSYVRLLPSVVTHPSKAPPSESGGVRFIDGPEDMSVKVVHEDNTHTLICRTDSGESSEISANVFEPNDQNLRIKQVEFVPARARWVSTDPPIYAASNWDESGEGADELYLLFTPCEQVPHFKSFFRSIIYGPDGVWAAAGHLYFDGRYVAKVSVRTDRDSGPSLAFAPLN
jgi:hypothetical protein